jgi:hypothetical protein
MQDAFEIEPAPHNQGDANGDQRQHDMQMADDGALQGGFVGHSDQVFSQEGFMAVAPEGTGDRAKGG